MWLDNVWVFITVPNFQSEVSRQYFLEQKIGTIKSNSIGGTEPLRGVVPLSLNQGTPNNRETRCKVVSSAA